MKQILFSLAIIVMFGCGNSKISKNKSKFSIHEIKSEITKEESFDTILRLKGGKIRFQCYTKCDDPYSVSDTINDSTINLYQNRYFDIKLQNDSTKTKLKITKELIKEVYGDMTFKKSLLVYPSIDSLDTIKNIIKFKALFMYPGGLGGTDFFETIIFDISLNGKVKFDKIIHYEQPEID
ncbi:MAG TPA: hypothetical protein VIH57_21140 [Bacteroidales bacterium]